MSVAVGERRATSTEAELKQQLATVLAAIDGALPPEKLNDPTTAVRGQFAAGDAGGVGVA
jgi:hypothetical protein